MKKEWVEMTAWVKAEQRERFHEKYSGCFSRFVRSCVDRALSDDGFLPSVMFGGWNERKGEAENNSQ